jgi:1-acyl-sn-glycerol-3-phosphate acyltransferase
VTVRIGDPHQLLPAEDIDNTRPMLRVATDRLMESIAGLSGQPYLDRYAARGALA